MNCKFIKSAFYLSTALSVVATIPTSALAAAAADSQSGVEQIEQVIVTATRREQRLQDVPISISVFNQQQLANNNITTASDLGTYTPSLSTDTRFGSDTATFAIRGFTQEIRTTPSVGVYFADVIAPTGGGSIMPGGDGAGPGMLFDLQNVQVLKGPQGTLFGRNTTGGAILIVPKKPTPMFGGYVEGSIGNYNMKRIQGVLNVPLSDKVLMRLGVDHESRDGYLRNLSNIGPSRFQDVDYTAARASFVVNITPDIENYTVASYSKSDHAGGIAQIAHPNTGFISAYNSAVSAFGAAYANYLSDPTNLAYAAALASAQSAVGASFFQGTLATAAQTQVATQAAHGYYSVMNAMPNPRNMLEQWQLINTTTWQATDNLTVKNIISYAQLKSDVRTEVFGDYFLVPPNPLFANPYAGSLFTQNNVNPPPGYHTNNQSTFTEELQFQGNGLGNKLIWQGGLYMQMSDPLGTVGSLGANFASCPDLNNMSGGFFAPQCSDVLGLGLSNPLQGGGSQIMLSRVTYRDYAAYAQATYDITDQVKFTGGIRYTYDHSKGWGQAIVWNYAPLTPAANPIAANCLQGYAGAAYDPANPRGSCISTSTQNSRAPTWMVQLQYTPLENAMVYAKYSRGYRQGNVAPNSPFGFQKYKQEKVDTYEVGAKTSWDGQIPGVFDFAAFYNDFSNQQLQIGFAPLSGGNAAQSASAGEINGKKSRIWGIEVNTSVSPLEGLRFDVGYSYLNSLLKSFDLNGAAATALADGFAVIPTTAEGYELPNTPKNKVTLTGTYSFPIPDTLGKLSLSATYVYTSSYLTAVTPETTVSYTLGGYPVTVPVGTPYGRIPPHRLLNMNLNWIAIGGSQFDGSFFVTNLLDAKYESYVGGTYEGYGFEYRTLGEPRMFGMRLRYNFD